MNQCELQALFSRQAVQPPYFAFSDVWKTSEGLLATFSPEQPRDFECGPIAAAEVGRHLAILGASAAAADAGDGVHYYLASKARLLRADAWPGECSQLEATAQVVERSRRSLTTTSQVLAPDPIYTLDCTYEVLPERLFQRLFQSYRRETNGHSGASPYGTNLALEDLAPIENGMSAICGPLPPNYCAGHFANYPTWPVAVVCHALIRLAGRALHRVLGETCEFSVVQADVSAEHLAMAENRLSLTASYQSADDSIYTFDCVAATGSATVGTMRLRLEPVAQVLRVDSPSQFRPTRRATLAPAAS